MNQRMELLLANLNNKYRITTHKMGLSMLTVTISSTTQEGWTSKLAQ